MVNPADLFQKPAPDVAWLESALKTSPVPRTLQERNTFQLMLVERYRRQFGGTKLQALQRIATAYATHFPH